MKGMEHENDDLQFDLWLDILFWVWGVVAKWISALNSSSSASVQQSVGLNPGRDTCVPEQGSCDWFSRVAHIIVTQAVYSPGS